MGKCAWKFCKEKRVGLSRWCEIHYNSLNSETGKKSRSTQHLRQFLKNEYGMSLKDYNLLLKKQNGKCAICKTSNEFGKRNKRPSVDHDHLTGKIRGLLCPKCNFLLGFSRDDIEILKNSIEYLEENG